MLGFAHGDICTAQQKSGKIIKRRAKTMYLTWVLIGLFTAAAGVITVAVFITADVIRELMRNNSQMNNAFSATIERKFKEGNHTVIKVRLKDYSGNISNQEIRSERGASVYEGQIIYK